MDQIHPIVERIAAKVNVSIDKVNSVLNLSSQGATVAFIARYRKEQTGGVDETVIRSILKQRDYVLEILDRQETIIKAIDEQKKLTKELKDKILNCFNKLELEDIYAPYKQKRKTKADIAKELGLEPLADTIFRQRIEEGDYKQIAKNYIDPLKKLNNVDDVTKHVTNIVVEKIAHNVELKKLLRNITFKTGFIISKKSPRFKEEKSKFENYYNYKEKISNLVSSKNSHRILAVRRGFNEKILSMNIDVNYNDCVNFIKSKIITNEKCIFMPILNDSINIAYKSYLAPSIETDIFNEIKEFADKEAINVFSKNAKDLLLKAPLGEKTVLGVDPGFKTGSKLALVSSTGEFKENATIYPVAPHNKTQEANNVLIDLCTKYDVFAIAVGNGTASREVFTFVESFIKSFNKKIIPVLVSEAGASIYSASDVARHEFPNLDLTIRGAISIARRLQDPLSELVKIDSKSIGVGQYQHDVDQNQLKASLDAVVEDCVNFVGVDLNTASVELLSYVSGINSLVAKNIVEKRNSIGQFKSRNELLTVDRLGEKAYEQCAGFLRIRNALNPLDNTSVHPEKYEILNDVFKKMNVKVEDLIGNEAKINEIFKDESLSKNLGEYTYKDILNELKKPGRDPRESFKKVDFNENVNSINDLKVGMILNGVVSNITNFGVFIDLGVHVDGLAHISQLTDKSFVKNPRDFVNLGDQVKVRIIELDTDKKQIALSFKLELANKFTNNKKFDKNFNENNKFTKDFTKKNDFKNKDNKNDSRNNRNENRKFSKDNKFNKNQKFDKNRRPMKIDPNSPFASLMSIRDKVKK